MNTLRLAIVTRTFWPHVGAAETMAVRLAAGLVDAGCTVTVLTARWQKQWPPCIRYHDVAVRRIGPPPDGRWTAWWYRHAVGRWLRRNAGALDAAYVFGLRQEADAVLRAVGARLPVVLRAQAAWPQGGWAPAPGVPGRCRATEPWMAAPAVVCRCEADAAEAAAAGYPRGQIHSVHDGVCILPPRTGKTRGQARTTLADANNSLRLPDWAPLAVYLGRWANDRGLEFLAAAWPPIARRWPNARLWFVGEGPFRDGLRRQISGLKLSGRAMLVGRFDHVEDLLAAADVLVHPGVRPTPSVAVAEAMGAGLPVIAADSPGHRALVEHDRTGLLVPPDQIAPISEALERLFDDRTLADRLGQTAHDRAGRHCALAQMVDQHVTLFTSLAERLGGGKK